MNNLLPLIVFAVLGFFLAIKYSKNAYILQRKIIRKSALKNYHIHHSLGGTLIIFIGLFIDSQALRLSIVGFGLGIFLEHIVHDGFTLISKETHEKNRKENLA